MRKEKRARRKEKKKAGRRKEKGWKTIKSKSHIETAQPSERTTLEERTRFAGRSYLTERHTFSENSTLLNVFKWVGIAYILYLAYDTFNANLGTIKKEKKKFKTRFSFYKDGFLVAGLSPKAIVFFGTIFSSFIDFNSNYYVQFFILMSTYVVLDFTTLMIYGFAAEKISKWLKGNPKILNTISACVLVVIALFIAVTQNI